MNLKTRLARLEANTSSPTVLGMWASHEGRPTYHQLAGFELDLERWFRTGELPKGAEFMAVIAMPEAERLWTPEPERRQPYEFTPTPEQLEEVWEPFPELHRDTLAQFGRMRQLPFYSFIAGQLRGMSGPLPSREQRTELYPHG